MTTLLLKFRNIFVFIICSSGSAMILLAMFFIMFDESFKVTTLLLKIQSAVIAIMFLLFDIEILYFFYLLIQSLYSLYTIDIAIIISLLYKVSIRTIFITNAFIFLLCNSKVLLKKKKIQATYTYEKLQTLKKTYDF